MLSVTKLEFSYLKLQRGDLDYLAGDFEQWLPAYWDKLEETFQSIKPYLPPECSLSLDIGSGLGGINVLIHRHYLQVQGKRPQVYILNGEDYGPVVVQHGIPFSSRVVALGFLYRHGVDAIGLIPKYLDCTKAGKFDLIVSFAAWSFHFPVSDYLSYVLEHSHQDTVLIVDARRPRSVEELMKHFKVEIIEAGKKYDRLAMRKR